MGDGAFSVVYKAYSLKTDKEVAVKVVRKNELSNNQVSFFRLPLSSRYRSRN